MRCPFCQADMVQDAQQCPTCKKSLEAYWRYRNAVGELERLQGELRNAAETIGVLEKKFKGMRRDLFVPLTEAEARAAQEAVAAVKAAEAAVPTSTATPVATGISSATEKAVPAPADASLPPQPPAIGVSAEKNRPASDWSSLKNLQPAPSPSAPATLLSGGSSASSAEAATARRAAARDHAAKEEMASEVGFGQKWMLIFGIVITLLGLGYFLKYSFDRQWIPEWARVAMAYFAAIGTVVLGGWFTTGKVKNFGLFLIGGGVGMLYSATYAGFGIYGLFGQPTAFGLMALTTAFSVFLALKFDTKWLAVLGQAGGFLTPVILATHQDNQIGLMTYMMILNIGMLWIAFRKQWTLLNYLSFGFTWLLFSGWAVSHYDPSKFATTMVFLNLFFLTHAVAPYLYFLLKPEKAQVQGFAITLPNSFLAMAFNYGFIVGMGGMQAAAVVSFLYAMLFVGMAQMLRRADDENRGPYGLLLAQAGLFLTITVPLLFSGGWITAAWAAMAAVAVFGGLRLSQRTLQAGAVILYFLTLAKLFLYDIGVTWKFNLGFMGYRPGYGTDLAIRWVTFAAVLGSLLAVCRLLRDGAASAERQVARIAAWIAFGVVLFLILNLEVAAAFQATGGQAQTTSISVLWSLFAVALMVLGFRYRLKALRILAIALLAFTGVKVLLMDMADVETPFRILSFVVLGVMLIGISYLYHRFADRLMGAPEEEPKAAEPEDWQQKPGWDQGKSSPPMDTDKHR